MTVNTFQVSLMSHSCVSNLEVVNPPSRSISFRVKRPVRTIFLFLVSCFSHLGQPVQPQNLDIKYIQNKVAGGVGEFRNCFSQTFHRKAIKFCCELGFIWCNSRLWWTGKVKVQLCLSWKKMKVQLRLSAKSESARTNCSGFMSLACFPSALHLAWQRKAIIALYLALYLLSQHQPWLPNLHISSAYTVPCWLRHWPKVFVNQSPNKINTCSGRSWRGADLELHKCSPTAGSHSEQTSWHLDVQMHLPQVKNMVNRSSSDKKNWRNRFLKPLENISYTDVDQWQANN